MAEQAESEQPEAEATVSAAGAFIAHETPGFDASAFEQEQADSTKAVAAESPSSPVTSSSELTTGQAEIPAAPAVSAAESVIEPAQATTSLPIIAEIAEEAPKPQQPAATEASEALDTLLAQSSLQMVETRADAERNVQAYEAPKAPAQRPTRTRVKVAAEAEALVQVETQNDNTSVTTLAQAPEDMPPAPAEAQPVSEAPVQVAEQSPEPELIEQPQEADTAVRHETEASASEAGSVAESVVSEPAPSIDVQSSIPEQAEEPGHMQAEPEAYVDEQPLQAAAESQPEAVATSDETVVPEEATASATTVAVVSEELESVLQQRGLELVETSATAVTEAYAAPAVKLGRPRKAPVQIESEPLELVETK